MIDEKMKEFLDIASTARWRRIPSGRVAQFRKALAENFVKIGFGGVVQLTVLGEQSRRGESIPERREPAGALSPGRVKLLEAWDEMDNAAQRVATSLPSQLSEAVARLDAARLAMRDAVHAVVIGKGAR